MLYRLSRMLDNVYVKVALVCLCVPATIWVAAPLPVLVMLWGINKGLEDSATIPFTFLMNAFVLGAIWGLAAVWLRIFLSSSTLRRPIIFWLTTLGLAVGVAEVGAILIMLAISEQNLSEPIFWTFVAAELLGVVLLAATAGARASPPAVLSSNERSFDAA